MNDFEDDFEGDQPDQTVTHGGYIPPLPEDHWSLQPSWKRFKESLSEAVPPSAPQAADVSEVVVDWKGFAYALSGAQEEIEETL